ncbi:POMP domain polymorphic outer membrane protein [Nitzschia inconspicua]|uniref:POMP domain polymorphic outer membrane protein n=1 Tax=Nitzschia inconspicua TaxID=303405 RepID=A0A9K3KNZ4_9STRA|nr:POMP domain polymorphic outer membrane protein [Nitzschia inconspicua]
MKVCSIHCPLLSFSLAVLYAFAADAQQAPLLTQEELCPDYKEIDPLKPCQTIQSYGELKELIEQSPEGASIDVCPFFLQKVLSVDPIFVRKSVQVTCVRKTADDFCVINGMGHHLWIDTAEDTRWQGMSFRASNEHAVYIAGDVENAETASHTFCQTSFIKNVRFQDTRGGAFMAEPSSGTVNIVQCLFSENFSSTFGAAIYSRTNQLNVINSIFVRNRANGYGGAIFTATGANLMIRDTAFIGNNGRESHDIVYNPMAGTETFVDGAGNTMNNGDCRGVFDLSLGTCILFVASTPQPTTPPTQNPSQQATEALPVSPTETPTATATSTVTTSHTTFSPSKTPTSQPTSLPPSKTPTSQPTLPLSKHPTFPPTGSNISSDSAPPTTRPTVALNSPQPTQMVANGNVSMNEPSLNPSALLGSQGTESPGPSHTDNSGPPSKIPTPYPITASPIGHHPPLDPSMKPSNHVYLGEAEENEKGIHSMCYFDLFEGECIKVESFQDFYVAITQLDGDIVFCGGFQIRKPGTAPLRITAETDIRCLETCTIFGFGPFIQVGGPTSKVRFSNMKFMMAESDTAVQVSTTTSLSQTTFCDIEFEGNNVRSGRNGGALSVDEGSGVVNVVRTTFTNNSASKGGAIYSHGFAMNVVESRFVDNKAYDVGNAIYIGEESQITINSSIFLLNTIVGISDVANPQDVAIAVEPSKTIRSGPRRGASIDAGNNRVIMSGVCNGFFNLWDSVCLEFAPMHI